MLDMSSSPSQDLRRFLNGDKFGTVMADPPWRFTNRTGKVAPEHKRLSRYPTMTLEDICDLPVAEHLEDRAHCYLWVPNALLPDGLRVLSAWGFDYKSNIIWQLSALDRVIISTHLEFGEWVAFFGPSHRLQANACRAPGRANEPHDQGGDGEAIPLRQRRPTADAPRRRHGRIQLRTQAQDPQRTHALRIHLQNLDFRGRSAHP